MALLTGGTSSTTVLSALLIAGNNGAAGTPLQNAAAFNALVKDQTAANNLVKNITFEVGGRLFLPQGRGVITLRPGDYIMVDPTSGWPIVLSAAAIAGGAFVHS